MTDAARARSEQFQEKCETLRLGDFAVARLDDFAVARLGDFAVAPVWNCVKNKGIERFSVSAKR
ncbi:hypothetical protein [Mesorhizobium sp.]|uniref:hypothetical protein n=1 Tax=Mesorhizobium sp. TaxID=1871066 RepID=UPI0025D24426|nr:hypothetical protein [Mesorhizobium sp.]